MCNDCVWLLYGCDCEDMYSYAALGPTVVMLGVASVAMEMDDLMYLVRP